MTKEDLISGIAVAAGITKKQAGSAYQAVVDAVQTGVKAGQEVRLHDIGTFRVGTRPARTGRNPQSGESIAIPESKVVTFKPVTALKKLANGK